MVVSLELMARLMSRTVQSREIVAVYRLIRPMYKCRHAAGLSPGPPADGIARTGRRHAGSVDLYAD